jgi:hypothetical protein
LDIKHAVLGANENTQIFGFADFDLEFFQVLQRDKFANPTGKQSGLVFFFEFFNSTFLKTFSLKSAIFANLTSRGCKKKSGLRLFFQFFPSSPRFWQP